MNKVLTITIPSYNVEKYLDKVLPTFLDEQILNDIELLIVNDGSKDKTKEIGEKYEKKYPDTVHVINKANGGHGSTINKGIELASGKYFKVVDGDDWVDTDYFVQYVNSLKKVDCDVIMTPYVRVNDNTGAKEYKGFNDIKFDCIYNLDDILTKINEEYAMHSITFKTDKLKHMRSISENCFYVDQEYIIYPLIYLNSIIFFNYPIYQYRVGNNEQSMSFKNKQKNRNMHLKVLNNIIDYYQTEEMSEYKKKFLIKRISGMINNQNRIYLSFVPSQTIKEELFSFTEGIKNKVPEIYSNIPGILNGLLRISNNSLYKLCSFFFRKKYLDN